MSIFRHTLLASGAALAILFCASAGAGVAPATNKQYIDECGACHFAYPPGLLPARSLNKILSNLSDHFGDNAELDAGVVKSINAYLATHAADKVHNRLSQRFAKYAGNGTPLRISETRYFKRLHHEVSRRLVQDNPKVKSFSRCPVCHTRAAQGSFSEREVRIPGHGRWD